MNSESPYKKIPSCWVRVVVIEILVVLVLAVAALAVSITTNEIFEGSSEAITAKDFVTQTVDVPLQAYRRDTGNYPTTAQGLQAPIAAPANVTDWKGPYLLNENKIPLDPWARPYNYVHPGPRNGKAKPDIWSLGPDTRTDSADYIGNW